MVPTIPRWPFACTLFLLAIGHVSAQTAPPDLAEFRTVENAITTRISKAPAAAVGQVGYLGIHVAPGDQGKLAVTEIAAGSPAARAGLLRGDLLLRIDGQEVLTAAALRSALQAQAPGAALKLTVLRQDKPAEFTAVLGAASRPLTLSAARPILGLGVGEPKDGLGVPVVQVAPGSPAARAGIKVGEQILKIDSVPLTASSMLTEVITEKKPGDVVTLTVRGDENELEVKVTLVSAGGGRGQAQGWDSRTATVFKKDVYRLAVVRVEYPDVKHNPKITTRDWEDALFSKDAYKKTSATGQAVHGSVNDYYQEQSYGQLRVEGKVFDWVEVGKKRADYGGVGGSNRSALLTEALDKLRARDGQDALKDFDGVFFMYAGDRVAGNRGDIYWPHRSTVTHQGRRLSYFICPEGGRTMYNNSTIAHEFGHMLGLPDLYARPENPGSEGVGVWCAMSNQAPNGRPQHFSAWCKEQLGWISPAVIDPTVKQKLILAPINDSRKECVKVLARLDGSEYFLLENRQKKGFDASLPADGLLIWRVVANRPILEESHGVEGPSGPRVYTASVPFPSAANNAFTPLTTPSSRPQLGGGLPVHITNIQRLPDGRITFYVGYDFQ